PNPPPYPDRFPHHHGATVTITLKDGRQFSAHVDFPRGSAPRGIEWADVDAKYRRLVPLSGLAPEKVEASLRVVHEFETVKTMSGAANGSSTRTSACGRVAPSTSAASSSSVGSALKKPIRSHVQNGTVNVGYDRKSAISELVAPSSASTR